MSVPGFGEHVHHFLRIQFPRMFDGKLEATVRNLEDVCCHSEIPCLPEERYANKTARNAFHLSFLDIYLCAHMNGKKVFTVIDNLQNDLEIVDANKNVLDLLGEDCSDALQKVDMTIDDPSSWIIGNCTTDFNPSNGRVGALGPGLECQTVGGKSSSMHRKLPPWKQTVLHCRIC